MKSHVVIKLFTPIFLAFVGVFMFAFTVKASITDGTIDSTYKYAWSERLGWINFGDTPLGAEVHVTDSAITGYAWSEKTGWIHMNPAMAGVTNNGYGVLGGYAWGEGIGYINFTGVTIDASGYFSGNATSTVSGSISFNCSNTASCGAADFKVRTDWRPISARPQCNNTLDDDGDFLIDFPADPDCSSLTDTSEAAGGGGGGGGAGITPTQIMTSISMGETCTSTRNVNVTIVGSDATEFVLSNYPDLVDGVWQPFDVSPKNVSWTLTAGDGVKNIYLRLRSGNGNASNTQTTSIILDEINKCIAYVPTEPPITPPSEPLVPGVPLEIKYGVIVYDQPNYEGRSELIYFNDPSLLDNLIGNDTISSIKVFGGAAVRLFQHINEGGRSELFLADDPDLSDNFIGSKIVSSLRFIDPANVGKEPVRSGVSIFEHINFLGKSQEAKSDIPDLRATEIGNDKISSLKIIGKAIVRVFKDIYYRGVSQLFRTDVADLRNELIGNDTISSIRVIADGSIVKGSRDTLFYVGKENVRHPFPNPAIFASWLGNYSSIKRISDDDLNLMQIGKNVTFRPGMNLVKIVNNPKVYAVQGKNTLRWIKTEELAKELYGATWATQVVDVSESLFADYQIGDDINNKLDYSPEYEINANQAPF